MTQRGVVDGIVADERTGMGESRARTGLAASDFQRYNRLATRAGLLRHPTKFIGMANTLQEECDRAGGVILKQIIHHIRYRDHRLIAHSHQQAQSNGVSLGKGQHRAGQRSTVENHSDRASLERRRNGQTIGRYLSGDIDKAVKARSAGSGRSLSVL